MRICDNADTLQFEDKDMKSESSEKYVPDERCQMSPSEIVQSKLLGLMSSGYVIPISCLHASRLVLR